MKQAKKQTDKEVKETVPEEKITNALRVSYIKLIKFFKIHIYGQ